MAIKKALRCEAAVKEAQRVQRLESTIAEQSETIRALREQVDDFLRIQGHRDELDQLRADNR